MFDETYSGNPLVNVFCLGIARHDAIVKGQASGVGNPVYYVGAKTGPRRHSRRDDGVGGVRREVRGEAAGRAGRRSVHGEAAARGVPRSDGRPTRCVGVQDMGAAGLTCSTCETGARGGVGIEIDVALVPQRETGMTPYEIMLSESQERMLLIVKRGREAEVERIFEKWDLHAVRIGEVTGDDRLRVKHHGVARRRRAEPRADR